jgi:O-antigen biosynthesis protein
MGIRGTNGDPGSPGTSIGQPNGGPGGSGGVGAYTIDGTGNIYGGTGGAGGDGYNSRQGYFGNGGAGGQGGAGVVLTGFEHVASTVNIYGGAGGAGGEPGHGLFTAQGVAGSGGEGGVGLYMGVGVVLTSSGGIYGGTGGAPGFGRGDILPGQGGDGVDLYGGDLVNFGHTTGGNTYPDSPTTSNGELYVHGGVGVYLSNGGVLENYGTISGGSASNGAQGDAVQFGSSAATLKVEPGGIFNGQIAGNASVNDSLELDGTQAGGTGITLGTQFTGFETLDFASGAQWTVAVAAGAATSHILTADGFGVGDVIDITNQSPSQVAGDFGATANALGAGSYEFPGSLNPQFAYAPDGTVTLDGNFSGKYFILTPDGHGGADLSVACFVEGTLIRTESGERPIEQLQIGDRVQTLGGRAVPIRWIGRRHYSEESLAERRDRRPVLFRTGTLGGCVPRRDLRVSPEHALYLDGVLVPASLLTDGISILPDDSVRAVNYYHLEFDGHEVIFAEGAAAESFVDDNSRRMFDNADEFADLYPNEPRRDAEFCAPRVEDGDGLQALRGRVLGQPGSERERQAVSHRHALVNAN